jgi:hypothetical protein
MYNAVVQLFYGECIDSIRLLNISTPSECLIGGVLKVTSALITAFIIVLQRVNPLVRRLSGSRRVI